MGGGIPILSALVPEEWSSYVFPPLDDIYRLLTVLLAVLASLGVFRLQDTSFARNRSKRPLAHGLLLLAFVASAGAYLYARTTFVRVVERPSVGDAVVVTIGFERTEFAQRTFPGASDWDVLRSYGTSQEELFRNWTPWSIFIGRLSLWLTYSLVLSFGVALLGLEVLFGVLDAGG